MILKSEKAKIIDRFIGEQFKIKSEDKARITCRHTLTFDKKTDEDTSIREVCMVCGTVLRK